MCINCCSAIYSPLDKAKCRAAVFTSLGGSMKLCGIYKIENTMNGKCYIGQSVDIKNRWKNHRAKLRRGFGDNPYLQNAWNKYGEENFRFSIVLLCEPFELTRYEQAIADITLNVYNARLCVDSCKGLHLSDEAKAKLSALWKGKPSNRVWSVETRARMSKAAKLRYASKEVK
jgi:group I intron endonuclease